MKKDLLLLILSLLMVYAGTLFERYVLVIHRMEQNKVLVLNENASMKLAEDSIFHDSIVNDLSVWVDIDTIPYTESLDSITILKTGYYRIVFTNNNSDNATIFYRYYNDSIDYITVEGEVRDINTADL